MYKQANKFDNKLHEPRLGDKFSLKTSKDECWEFIADYLLYEQYLHMCSKVYDFLAQCDQLSEEEVKLSNQLKKNSLRQVEGFKVMNKIKNATLKECETFLSNGIPVLREISEKAIVANSVLHKICNSFPKSLVQELRKEIHTNMLQIAQKRWPGKSIKEIKKEFAKYGIE